MSWNPFSSPQNWIVLDGKRSPGAADVKGASLEWRLDVRRSMGMTSAIIVWTGKELCPFSVDLRLYSEQDWDDWNVWSQIVLAKPKTSAGLAPGMVVSKALTIQHPLLAYVQISAAVVKKVQVPQPTGDTGEWTATIDFLEFRGAPKPMVAKAEGTKPASTDPYDVKIEQLTGQLQELAK